MSRYQKLLRSRLRSGLAAGLLINSVLVPQAALSNEIEISSSVGFETRAFMEQPAHAGQFSGLQPSTILQTDLAWESDDGSHQVIVDLWGRVGSRDAKRTHFDVREAYYAWTRDDWRVRAGLGRVFWGVTESRHLVDIINQTDFVEDVDEEDKLGQPMIELMALKDFGEVRFFVLPGFRKRTFPGRRGRMRAAFPVDTGAAEFESEEKEHRVDLAVRYSNYFGDWDVGLSLFHGTSREPRFPQFTTLNQLVPFYDVITQAGVDVQYTRDAWLWKFEGIVRSGHGDAFGALVAGFEYTFYGIMKNGADLSVLTEYLYDGRSDDPSVAPPTSMNNDVFLGSRLALNDVNDTALLAGTIIDIENGSVAALLEASRRLGGNWVTELEARLFFNIDGNDTLASFAADDSVMLRATRYF